MTCCNSPTCYFPADPPITAHDNEWGGSNWFRNFCKHPAVAGERFQLTDTVLMPGHMLHYVSFLIEIGTEASVPFTIGTDADPAKYGGADMNLGNSIIGCGFVASTPADMLITAETPIFVTMGADVDSGILAVKFMLSDAKPMGSRFGN